MCDSSLLLHLFYSNKVCATKLLMTRFYILEPPDPPPPPPENSENLQLASGSTFQKLSTSHFMINYLEVNGVLSG